MIEVDRFTILEEKVAELLDAYTILGREKATLDEKLATREIEIKSLKEKILYLSRARETARKKIEGLINRIEILISAPRLE
jgi:FtsZ-binding cell division protein ZapB